MDWQPIETAPRDGTRVLLWYPALQEAFVAPFEHGQWQTGFWTPPALRIEPTHWQHTPKPPETN